MKEFTFDDDFNDDYPENHTDTKWILDNHSHSNLHNTVKQELASVMSNRHNIDIINQIYYQEPTENNNKNNNNNNKVHR